MASARFMSCYDTVRHVSEIVTLMAMAHPVVAAAATCLCVLVLMLSVAMLLSARGRRIELDEEEEEPEPEFEHGAPLPPPLPPIARQRRRHRPLAAEISRLETIRGCQFTEGQRLRSGCNKSSQSQ